MSNTTAMTTPQEQVGNISSSVYSSTTLLLRCFVVV